MLVVSTTGCEPWFKVAFILSNLAWTVCLSLANCETWLFKSFTWLDNCALACSILDLSEVTCAICWVKVSLYYFYIDLL